MSALAEEALAQVMSRLADHRQLMRLDADTGSARGRRFRQLQRTRHGNALVDLVAVAESFAAGRLLRLRPAISYDEVSTWSRREKAWARHTMVNLRKYQEWSALMGFVHVRNALQHGLGRLTEQQLDRYHDKVLNEIHASSVNLNGDMLTVTADDVSRCGTVSAGFIWWLDNAAPIAEFYLRAPPTPS
jgi:hypothetical protein